MIVELCGGPHHGTRIADVPDSTEGIDKQEVNDSAWMSGPYGEPLWVDGIGCVEPRVTSYRLSDERAEDDVMDFVISS